MKIVISVDGTVTDALVVIDGDAVVNGAIDDDIIAVSGVVDLGEAAQVDNITLFDSQLNQTPGATVTGNIDEENNFWSGWDMVVFSAILWVSGTIGLILAALVFAAIGFRQLSAAGDLITDRLGGTVVAALLFGILIPIIAIVAFVTLLGIPVGLALFLLVMPVVWFLGYLVSSARLGSAILNRGRARDNRRGRYLGPVLGVLILQLLTLIPFIGGVVAVIAGVLGSGALVLLAWRAWRGTTPTPAQPQAPPEMEPAPAT